MRAKPYKSILKRWEGLCIICGEPFINKKSMTREHLIPLSNKRGKNNLENLAVSHFRCNQRRQDLSLIRAMKIMLYYKSKLGEEGFIKFVNASVPNRIMPRKYYRKRATK